MCLHRENDRKSNFGIYLIFPLLYVAVFNFVICREIKIHFTIKITCISRFLIICCLLLSDSRQNYSRMTFKVIYCNKLIFLPNSTSIKVHSSFGKSQFSQSPIAINAGILYHGGLFVKVAVVLIVKCFC